MHTRLLTTVAASLMILAACNNNELPTGVDQSLGTDPSTSTVLDESSALAWHRAGHRATLVDAVETWNDDIEQFARLASVSPPAEARISAMANMTVHDVLNAVERRYEPYAYDTRVNRSLSVEAAIADRRL